MAQKTRIGGTNYDISGGKTCVNGTNYSVNNGKTRVSSTNKNISFALSVPPWSSGDVSVISAALDAYHNGENVDFSAWKIGDQRNITINGNIYQLVLAHKFSGTPINNTEPYAFSGKVQYPAYAVICVPQCGTSKYMSGDSLQKYFNGALHAYCNNTIYNKIKNTDIGQCFKLFQCYVGKENGQQMPSSGSGTYNQQVYIASLACKEVGSFNFFNPDEDKKLIKFDYFNSTTLQISGQENYWLRSPANGNPRYGFYSSMVVDASTGRTSYEYCYLEQGVVWFGCI